MPSPAESVNRTLLIVDDEAAVRRSLSRMLRPEGYEILTASDGKEGSRLLETIEPGVILSDLKMPHKDGIAFLEEARRCRPATVRLLLTAYADLNSALAAINRCAVFGFQAKPWEPEPLRTLVVSAFDHYNLGLRNRRLQGLQQIQNRCLQKLNGELDRRVRQRTAQLEGAVREGVVMLAKAAEAKDDCTGGHVQRIRDLSCRITLAMGMDPEKAAEIGFFSMMHDIGKIHIPDAILKKKGPLTALERRRMETHTLAGERILGRQSYYHLARQIARHHHERWDGGGYPDGLRGESIPLPARIVAVADVFDALLSDRPYRKGIGVFNALDNIVHASGSRFDPKVVEALRHIINRGGEETVARVLEGAGHMLTADA
jgi:response regulator RpfG family c-di-GMP phosphodiesterase